jgi:hypothetical protein
MYPTYYSSPNSADVLGSHPSRPLSPDQSIKRESEGGAMSSFTDSADAKQLVVRAEQPPPSRPAPRVSTLARRIHGWSWQAVWFYVRVGGIVSSLFIPLIVPYRYGNWCCLCHSFWLEGSPWTDHTHRDGFFLHQPFAFYPQLINPPDSSIMCDSCTFGLFPCLTMDMS